MKCNASGVNMISFTKSESGFHNNHYHCQYSVPQLRKVQRWHEISDTRDLLTTRKRKTSILPRAAWSLWLSGTNAIHMSNCDHEDVLARGYARLNKG